MPILPTSTIVLLEYGSAGAFVDGVMPFLSDGMKLGEPSLVVVSARHLAILRDLLGPDATDWVRFADSDAWGSGNVPTRGGEYQIQCLALAATEIVTNVLHHAGTIATIKTWTEESRFCCEIADKGPGIADPMAAYQPPAPAAGRCGLWLARNLQRRTSGHLV
ncbi:MAG: ATP-binding protein [Pseudonocardiaceae bacterium]